MQACNDLNRALKQNNIEQQMGQALGTTPVLIAGPNGTVQIVRRCKCGVLAAKPIDGHCAVAGQAASLPDADAMPAVPPVHHHNGAPPA